MAALYVRSLWMGAGIWKRGRRGSALVSPTHTSAPPSPSIRAAWTDCRALLVPSESRFCFPRMTTLPPDILLYGVPHSHDSCGQRQSEKLIHLGFPSSRSSLPSYSLLGRGSCGSTDRLRREAGHGQLCCLLLISQGIWTWGPQGSVLYEDTQSSHTSV